MSEQTEEPDAQPQAPPSEAPQAQGSSVPLPRVALLALMFFLSGAGGLVYEVSWSKRLELTFGSTSHSIGTILAAYMAGLGLGAWCLGRLADRPGSAARRYALLEAGIGVYALVSPWVLDLVEWLYVAVGGTGGIALKAVLGLIAIMPATILMGGTLPVLARSLIGQRGDTQRAVGLLYGINTLGAVAGAILAGFFLVDALGIDMCSRATGIFNLSLAAVAFLLGPRLAPDIVAPLPEPAEPQANAPLDASRQLRVRLAVIVTFGSGLVALALEVAWTRALSFAFGSTGHGFTIMLAATLLGIGAGSLLVARASSDERAPLGQLTAALLLFAGANYVFLSGFELLPKLLFVVAQAQVFYYDQFLAAFFFISAAVLFPATLALGIAFPLCTQLGTRAAGTAGQVVGRLYLSNTLGAILGSLLGAFLFVPWIGTEWVIRLGALAAALGAVWLSFLSAQHGRWSGGRARLGAAVGCVLAVAVLARPGWDPSSLDMGPTRQRPESFRQPGDYHRSFTRGGFTLLYADEGVNAYVTVRAGSRATTMFLGGKPDASSIGDMPTQLMCGVVPFLARPEASRALVVGAGSGVTTRVVAGFPTMEHVDLVEIEETMVEAASLLFSDVNRGVFSWPNLNVIYDDARTFLLARAPDDYDLIVSVPTNPSIAGVANLFTLEHYQNAKQRLRPGGVYMQWMQLYESDDWMARAMLNTFLESFEYVDLWWANPLDLLLIGSDEPFVYDVPRATQAVVGNEELRRDLWPYLRCRAPEELFARFVASQDALRAVTEGADVLRDDLPRLEGHAAEARYLGAAPYTLRQELFSLLEARSRPWPALTAPPPTVDLRLPLARYLSEGWSFEARRLLEDLDSPEAVALKAKLSPLEKRTALLTPALEREPADPQLLLELALTQLGLGDPDAARQSLARVASQDLEGLPSRFHLVSAQAIQPDSPERARAVTASVLAGLHALLPRPEDMSLRTELLFRLADCAQFDPDAIALLNSAFRDVPHDEQAGLALALALVSSKNPNGALEVLEVLEAENSTGSIAFARRLRLRALDEAGRDAELVRELDRYLRDFPLEYANPQVYSWIQRARRIRGPQGVR